MSISILQKIQKHGLKKSARLFASKAWDGVSGLIRKKFLGSYSQLGEDLVLEGLMGQKKDGCYIDIGASHPYEDSNTMHFYKKGWTGINIEPNYVKFQAFKSAKPRDVNLNIGIGKTASRMDFYVVDPPQLSSFSKEEADRAAGMGHRIAEVRKVEVMPLADVIAKHAEGKKIDFISIDTEGFEIPVLQSNDWIKYRPRFICIEYVRYSDGSEVTGIYEFLKGQGYARVHANGLNSIYRDERE
jgi:FkbM family methyltransferase